MFVLAVAMIPIVVVQVTATDPAVLLAAEIVNSLIWVAFVVEYLYLLRQAEHRLAFVRRRWLDLLVIVLSPPFVVPVELASTRVLRLLRLVRLIAVLGRMHEGTRRATGRQGLVYVATVVFIVVFMGGVSLYTLEPERAPTVWDGLWWALTTVTTVGYGDIVPKTWEGRFIGAALMVIGLGSFGVLAGSVGAIFSAPREDDSARLERIESELRGLRTDLDRERRA
jgi:voltage-gated potassium channel